MNWLFIIVLVAIVLSAAVGYYRGAVRTVFSMGLLILVMVLAGLSPFIGNFLREHTSLAETVRAACSQLVNGSLITAQGETALTLPEGLVNIIANTQAGQKGLGGVYMAEYLADLAVDVIAFFTAFLLVWIAVKILMRIADGFTGIPVVSVANRLCGAALGIVRALFWVWIFLLLLVIFGGTSWGSICMRAVQSNLFLKFLYDNNLILNLVFLLLR